MQSTTTSSTSKIVGNFKYWRGAMEALLQFCTPESMETLTDIECGAKVFF